MHHTPLGLRPLRRPLKGSETVTWTVIVLAPYPGGQWQYHRAFTPLYLADDDIAKIRGLGAEVSRDDHNQTCWIRAENPPEVIRMLEAVPRDDKPLAVLFDELEEAIRTGDYLKVNDRIETLRRRTGIKDEAGTYRVQDMYGLSPL